MSKAYKFTLTFITLLIIASIILGVTYLFYDKEVSESTIVLVDGNLSINFLDGNVIKNKEEKTFDMRFSVTNNSDEEASYKINIEDVKNKSENISLVVTNTSLNSVINETKFPQEEATIVDSVQIASGETHNYKITINNNDNISFDGILKIREEKPTITTFAQTILDNNAVSNTTLTNVGEEVAIEDEGLISDIDDSGSTYYFRGKVENNYVNFANLSWRIIRINGDGTVKMILDTTDETVQAFYTKTDEEFYTFNNSSIKEYLNSWYSYNLQEYDDYIAIDKYCNDYTTTNETDFVYNSYVRNVTNKIPTFNCLGKNVGTKIGLITADEVIYAGGLYKENNTSYYLYNTKITGGWWTMTPASGNATSMNPFIVNESGALNSDVLGSYNRGIRPVISLIKDIAVTGKGTSDNPYVIDYETK